MSPTGTRAWRSEIAMDLVRAPGSPAQCIYAPDTWSVDALTSRAPPPCRRPCRLLYRVGLGSTRPPARVGASCCALQRPAVVFLRGSGSGVTVSVMLGRAGRSTSRLSLEETLPASPVAHSVVCRRGVEPPG